MKKTIKMGLAIFLSIVMGIMFCACESDGSNNNTSRSTGTTQDTRTNSNDPIIGKWKGIAIQDDKDNLNPIIGVTTDATFTKDGKASITLADDHFTGTWTRLTKVEEGTGYTVLIPDKTQFSAAIANSDLDQMGLAQGDFTIFFERK